MHRAPWKASSERLQALKGDWGGVLSPESRQFGSGHGHASLVGAVAYTPLPV